MEKYQHQLQDWVQQLGTAATKAMCSLDCQPELVKQTASQHVDDGQELSPPADVRIVPLDPTTGFHSAYAHHSC